MSSSPAQSPIERVRDHLLQLQDDICAALEQYDGEARFSRKVLEGERGGLARPRVLDGGPRLERAAVNFSHTKGVNLPAAATERKPELAGREFQAASVSLIVHPRNPHIPTCHANFRFFVAEGKADQEDIWWFGGGFDLTPYYGYREDAVHWHRMAADACDGFGDGLYEELKRQCDQYFYLPHRREARGVGGIFYDDFDRGGFERAFEFHQSTSAHFLLAYLPIIERRRDAPFSQSERDFQLYRRGRYVEFNLLYDRGTKFGLQAGSRTESLLASLPPIVHWRYDFQPEPGSPEHELTDYFLQPQDWLAVQAGSAQSS